MITAVGTLLAALVALATFLVSQQFFAGSPSTNERPGGQGAPPTDAEGKKLDGQVMWGPKPMLIRDDIEFDSADGPVRNPQGVDADVYHWWVDDTISSPSGMAKWTSSEAPTQAGCADIVATHGTPDHLPFEEGDRFCFRTSKARIAFIEVIRETSTGWEANGTVWKQRLIAG